MNKAWDGWESPAAYQRWCTAWAEEAFRVMKPGAHIVAFGGTRTYHRLAAALEDAGFEIRDSLAYMFGSGFPKSLDVSKAIDKAQGAAREPDTYTGANQLNRVYGENMGGGVTIERGTPATPEAAAWQGWGTALKPAYEPVVLARKPFNNSVAGNVLEHGTGALNIDACRIATAGETPSADRRDTSRRTDTTPGNPGAKDGTIRPAFTDRTSAERYTEERPGEQLGRWPANVALSHHPDCRLVGTRRVRGHPGYPNGPRGNMFTVGGDPDGTGTEPVPGHADEEGLETVEDWECVEDCPVRMLDEQSGDTGASGAVSGREPTSQDGYQGTMYGARTGNDSEHPFYGDRGGASRFFYTAKASRSERNAGLEDLPEVTNPSYQPRTKRCTICGSTSVNGKARDQGAPTMMCGHPDSAVELVDPQRAPTAANHHPTVKPVELMRWLVRLVTPPGGRVLDPFLGSGTTGIAAALEGFRFVGIERDAEYVEIARRRIAYWAEHGEEALDVVRRRETAERERQAVADSGQLDLFGGGT